MVIKTVVTMRIWWDNKSWRLGNIREQNFCIVRKKKFIKISWFLILVIILFFRNLRIFYQKFILLTPDREHSKVFEDIPIIGFKKGKSLRDILVRAKVPPLKTERVSVVHAINQGVKFANILPKHTSLNHHWQSAYIPLDRKIWIALLRI